MTHPITSLGVLHTAVSLVPIIAGIYSFARYRKIDPAKRSGMVYLIGTTLAVITSFGVSSTGGLNAGHAFGVLVLIAALGGAYAPNIRFLGKARPYLSVFGLSFSFLLSLVPGTNETLSRLPPSHPLANGPTSPAVQATLLVWLVIFIAGFATQCWRIKSRNGSGMNGAARG
ncbi:hypothetical protein P3T18_004237 [Paraburkholderia sp. GAS199]|uniref:hypothetical protein n=1 Tax=Paraburkholderia sp. GAS199 TaxID=3035126 RepID=UPI003D1CD190